jgi:hypothetical protein
MIISNPKKPGGGYEGPLLDGKDGKRNIDLLKKNSD